jgi:hypothetical protein
MKKKIQKITKKPYFILYLQNAEYTAVKKILFKITSAEGS